MTPAPKRRWFRFSSVAVLLSIGAVVVFFLLRPKSKLADDREDFATILSSLGGSVTYAEPPHSTNNGLEPAEANGDTPVSVIKLPYGLPDYIRRRAELLFPEAQEISVLPGDTAILRLFGGSETLQIVENPEKVEAYRLAQIEKPVRTEQSALDDYSTIGDPVQLPPMVASRISDALLDPESYRWHAVLACLPNYGVRVTFFQANDRVDVLLCFECDLLLILRNNRVMHGEAFRDKAHNLLAATMKDLFPHDKVIQSIPTKSEGCSHTRSTSLRVFFVDLSGGKGGVTVFTLW